MSRVLRGRWSTSRYDEIHPQRLAEQNSLGNTWRLAARTFFYFRKHSEACLFLAFPTQCPLPFHFPHCGLGKPARAARGIAQRLARGGRIAPPATHMELEMVGGPRTTRNTRHHAAARGGDPVPPSPRLCQPTGASGPMSACASGRASRALPKHAAGIILCLGAARSAAWDQAAPHDRTTQRRLAMNAGMLRSQLHF